MSIRQDKIRFFEQQLADFFHKAGREHLPWRKKRITAYEVWVSEIMLQQTQVSRVIGYYREFLKRFPTVEKLAETNWEQFLPYYQGLGYYVRGRNMLKAAQVVMQEYGGTFPRDKKLLEKIPGIGPYTAAAIMSFAYEDNHLAWDTNLKRVIGRFFYGTKQVFDGSRVKSEVTKGKEDYFEDEFKTPRKELNAALMDFGSALCVARPKCAACALQSRCTYYQEKGQQETSSKKQTAKSGEPKMKWRDVQVFLFLHENHQKYFSSMKKHFQPFVLHSGYNTRAGIKQYFLKKYGLTLSVRPPHRKLVIKGKPTILVNAQILLGEPAFAVFSKKALREYTESSL